MKEKATVDTPVPGYKMMEPAYRLADDLMGGTRQFRAKEGLYLPREEGESRKSYENRLGRAVLFGAWKTTIQKLVAMPFTKPPTNNVEPGNDNRDPREQKLDTSVDRKGTTAPQFGRRLTGSILRKGAAYFIVDMPEQVKGRTLLDQDKLDIRPYFAYIDPSNIIGWEFRQNELSRKSELVSLRVRDTATRPAKDNPFQMEEVRRVRHYEVGQMTVYTKREDDKEWVKGPVKKLSYPGIPLVSECYNEVEPFCPTPPLDDLAIQNVEHYQSTADQRNILHIARLPILFGAGFEEGALDTNGLGAGQYFSNERSDAKLSYVEIKGGSIEAGQKDIVSIEMRMSALGIDLLVKRETETATAASIKKDEQTCQLQDIVVLVEGMLERGYEMAGKWVKGEFKTKWTFHKEFGIDLRQHEDLELLLRARAQNEISRETWLSELSRRSVVHGMDEEEEQKRLEQEDQKEVNRIMLAGQAGNDN